VSPCQPLLFRPHSMPLGVRAPLVFSILCSSRWKALTCGASAGALGCAPVRVCPKESPHEAGVFDRVGDGNARLPCSGAAV
jgi:hypothetical protein